LGASNGGNGSSRLQDRLVELFLDEDQVQTILTTRAAVLARTPGDEDKESTQTQYVTFKLGAERYGLDVGFVEEIQPLKELTLIPCTPDFVVGAVNIRGSILPVVDIKKFFGIPATDIAGSDKVMVVKVGEMQMGLLADRVEEVLDLANEDIEPQLATLSGAQEEFIKGVCGGQVIILDIEALANDRRMIIHEDI